MSELLHNEEEEVLYELDNDTEIEVEVDENGKSFARRKAGRQFMLQLGEKARARFVEGNPNIFFELRVEKTDNDSEEVSYKNDGYMGKIYNVLKYAREVNTKDKLFNKGGLVTIDEMLKAIKESDHEMKLLAREIIKEIKLNKDLAIITEEVLDRVQE